MYIQYSATSRNLAIAAASGALLLFSCTPRRPEVLDQGASIPMADREGDILAQGGSQNSTGAGRGAERVNLESDVEAVARLYLSDPKRSEHVRDATRSYPWVTNGRVYWVGDRKVEPRRVVVFTHDGSFLCLSCSRDLRAITKFIVDQSNGALLFDSQVRNLAKFFKDIAVEPNGLIATEEFLTRERNIGLAARGVSGSDHAAA
jgi:hypothetical protein